MTQTAPPPAPPRANWRWSAFGILVAGVVVVPVALALITLPRGETPDDADYVRMAFATVAGQTVAVLTVLALLVSRIARRARATTIGLLAVIAFFVISTALSSINGAADQLVRVLG